MVSLKHFTFEYVGIILCSGCIADTRSRTFLLKRSGVETIMTGTTNLTTQGNEQPLLSPLQETSQHLHDTTAYLHYAAP